MSVATLKLLRKPSFTEEQLRDSLGEIETKLAAGPQFDFRMRVPAGWSAAFQPDADPKKGGAPVLLAHVSRDDNLDIEVRVICAVLEREMNPTDWLELWLMKTDQGMIDATTFKTSYGILGDALTHNPDKTVPGTCRVFTVKDGDRLFLIEARSRADNEQSIHLMQNIFLVAVSTFELLNPTKERFAEPFRIEALAGDGPLPYFLVPESWEAHPQSQVPDGGDALLFDNGGDGTMMVVATPFADEEEMLEEVLHGKFSATEGLELFPLRKGFAEVPNASFEITARGCDGVKEDGALEFAVAKVKGPKMSAAVALLTPSPDSDHRIYAINRRAFEVLVESLEMNA